MGSPAIVMNDRITGMCAIHQIPNPPSGAPQPGPPMPFSAPLLQGLEASVLIAGQPAAVLGSSGMNTPPHVGLHASDPIHVQIHARVAVQVHLGELVGLCGAGKRLGQGHGGASQWAET